RSVERQMMARLSGAYLFAAAAYFNGWAGFVGADRAWVYAGIGTAAWLGLSLAGARVRGLTGVLAPMGAVALALAAWVARTEPSVLTIVLTLGAAGPALAFPATRLMPLWGLATLNGLLAVATGWEWADLD